MQVPFLSIVIPVYNAEHTISRAIKSITSQEFDNLEIIIVNDGSTDQSFKICNELSIDNQMIRLFHRENAGVSTARNYGIEQARGKYITFLDADDYYSENFFKIITSEIEENTQLLLYGYNIVRNGVPMVSRLPLKENVQFRNKYEFRETAVTLISNEMINAPWNKIYLTSYIKNNKFKFPTDIDIGEDLSFNLLVIKGINFVKVCNQTLVNYTVKKGEGLVSRFRPNRLEIRISLLEQIKGTLDYWNILSENQSMLDRLIVRDFMASFIDLYKKTCKLSNKEKLTFIKNVLIREDKKLKKCSTPDISTYILKVILRTKNSVIILFFAKLLSLKRGFR